MFVSRCYSWKKVLDILWRLGYLPPGKMCFFLPRRLRAQSLYYPLKHISRINMILKRATVSVLFWVILWHSLYSLCCNLLWRSSLGHVLSVQDLELNSSFPLFGYYQSFTPLSDFQPPSLELLELHILRTTAVYIAKFTCLISFLSSLSVW